MTTNDLIIDEFERIREVVHQVLKGLSKTELSFRPSLRANSIAWLIWHLSRIQDDHMAGLTELDQLWDQGWREKFSLPFSSSDTGYSQSSDDVAKVKSNSTLLKSYYDAVHNQSLKIINQFSEKDYQKIVDKRWDPPVTLAVRLVSVISDDMQHAGQAAYVKGLLK